MKTIITMILTLLVSVAPVQAEPLCVAMSREIVKNIRNCNQYEPDYKRFCLITVQKAWMPALTRVGECYVWGQQNQNKYVMDVMINVDGFLRAK